MIHNTNTVLPCAVVYECRHDFQDLVELVRVESLKPWSYLPFMVGWTDEMETTSEFASLMPTFEAIDASVPEKARLSNIGSLAWSCNSILEECLQDYLTYYSTVCSEDGGACMYRITGNNNYSTPIEPPDNHFIITAMMALTEIQIKFDRFETEFTVGPGDVYIIPAQFPHEHSIMGTPDTAYVLGKHLKA